MARPSRHRIIAAANRLARVVLAVLALAATGGGDFPRF
jgi:hypothetical protein